MEIKKAVEQIFCESDNQSEVLSALYKLAFPNYDAIERIEGFPTVGRELSQFIWSKFIEFDRIHHLDVLAGGLWMNKGFTEDRKLSPWEISVKKTRVFVRETREEVKSGLAI